MGWTTPWQAFPVPSVVVAALFRIRLRAMDVSRMAIYVDDVLIGVHTSSLEFSTAVGWYADPSEPVVTWQLVDLWC